MPKFDAIVVGAGLSGSVIARYLAEEKNFRVLVMERRNHIGGNMYDYVNEDGILVHKYGPHTFHTEKKELYEYMQRFSEWLPYRLTCGTVLNGKYTPMPFSFKTIDDFYEKEQAERIKEAIRINYPNKTSATILELINHKNIDIREFAYFLFDNDYSLYTAKQWGISHDEIDPSVLKRVPIRFNYNIGYFDDKYQSLPATSYTDFFKNLLNHENINLELNVDALSRISIDGDCGNIFFEGIKYDGVVVYTGPIDELFNKKYGELPYRSLRFEWRTINKRSYQNAPVVAYPQEADYTRITEYTKLPYQNVGDKTTIALEFPLKYDSSKKQEPYYPIPSEESYRLYNKYLADAAKHKNLYLSGRLAEYKYYNMDQALENALKKCKLIG